MSRLIETDPCFIKAMDDEPAFVLLARDPMMPVLMRLWASQRRIAIAEGARPASDLSQVEAVEREAEEAVHWRFHADESWRKQHQLDLA